MDMLNMAENDEIAFPQDAAVSSEASDKISELSKEGYQLLKNNKVEDAKDMFRQILKIEDQNNYALVGLGDSERKQNNYEKAIEYYSECLSCHPGNNYALFGLADCYKALSQYKKAIEIWEQYLIYDDRNVTVLTRVADAYRKIHDFKKSKELYLKVLEMEQNNAYALIGLGHLYYDFKEYKDALFYWTKMLEHNQEIVDIRVLTSIANCHRKLKTFDKGVIFSQQALAIDPKNFYALFGLADCYRGMHQQYKSIEYWNKILELDPKNKIILTRAGDAYRSTGDYRSAAEYYNKALEVDFDSYAALGLVLICKGEGKYEEAIERLKSLIKTDSKNFRFYIDLADCYVKLNRKNDAILCLEEAQKLSVRSPQISEMLSKLRG